MKKEQTKEEMLFVVQCKVKEIQAVLEDTIKQIKLEKQKRNVSTN